MMAKNATSRGTLGDCFRTAALVGRDRLLIGDGVVKPPARRRRAPRERLGFTAWPRCCGGGSGGGRGNAPPRQPCPVEQHRGGGCEQRGPDRDQDDLPAGHAAGDHGMDLDGGRGVCTSPASPGSGGSGLAKAAGVAVTKTSKEPASPASTAADRRMRWKRFMISFLSIRFAIDSRASVCRPAARPPYDIPRIPWLPPPT
jgi:hypothetical protein